MDAIHQAELSLRRAPRGAAVDRARPLARFAYAIMTITPALPGTGRLRTD